MDTNIFISWFVIFMIITVVYFNETIYVQEHLTLKTDCDVRNTNCIIACMVSDDKMNFDCFSKCVKISPIC